MTSQKIADQAITGPKLETLFPNLQGQAWNTYVKVEVDRYGRVRGGGANLNANDIPNLGAGKITTGLFNLAQIPDIQAQNIIKGPGNANQGILPRNVIPRFPPTKIAGRLDAARLPASPSFDTTEITQGIKIGTVNSNCNPQNEGMVRFNGGVGLRAMEFCNGSQWKRVVIEPPINCPANFIGVPGNDFYNTRNFCVMKYEAKQDPTNPARAISQASGPPWANINRAEAQAACQAAGFELLSNDHWQTMARNIERVPQNWANNQIGNVGGLNRGHSDGTPSNALEASGDDTQGCFGTGQQGDCNGPGRHQKRTHIVDNKAKNEVIWDMGGNVWEWMSDDDSTDYGASARNIAELTGAPKDRFGPSGDYSATLGNSPYGHLGQLAPGTGNAVLRGGNWFPGTVTGLFGATLHHGPLVRIQDIGFRCMTSPL